MSLEREYIEQLKASGRIDEATAKRLLEAGAGRPQRGPRGKARAVAVAVASGPNAKAEAHSHGESVEALAGPGESVYSSDKLD